MILVSVTAPIFDVFAFSRNLYATKTMIASFGSPACLLLIALMRSPGFSRAMGLIVSPGSKSSRVFPSSTSYQALSEYCFFLACSLASILGLFNYFSTYTVTATVLLLS